MTTTANTNTGSGSGTPKSPERFRLPDPPEHPDDKMTNFKQLAATGHAHHLAKRLGNPDTTLVAGGTGLGYGRFLSGGGLSPRVRVNRCLVGG